MPAPPADLPDLPDLLLRCGRREPAAQRALYARFAGRMLGVARRYAGSVAEAEDVLQDAFVKMFARLGEFRAEGAFEGWLRRIVVTTALNHWQSGQHRRRQQPLDYTIHFQNPRSAPAQNVILSDALDFQKLNPATLMVVAQSHSCIWSLTSTGPNTSLLTVRFLNINLPHRTQDVIRSQGFVRFRVQPRPTLAVGEIIPNHAADVLNVTTDLRTAGLVRLELFDGLGRAVRQQTFTAPAGPLRQQLDLRDLTPGLYVLRLTPPTGPALSRQVVRE